MTNIHSAILRPYKSGLVAVGLILVGLAVPAPSSATSWTNIANQEVLPKCKDPFQPTPCLGISPQADVAYSQTRLGDEYFVTLTSISKTPPNTNPGGATRPGPGRALVGLVGATDGHVVPVNGSDGFPQPCDFDATTCEYRLSPPPEHFLPPGTYWSTVGISTQSQTCDDTNGCRYFGAERVVIPVFIAHPAGDDPLIPICIACGDPNDDSIVSASDALMVLRAAVGEGACEACVCDVDGSGTVSASDALRVLGSAVGQTVPLVCDGCPGCIRP